MIEPLEFRVRLDLRETQAVHEHVAQRELPTLASIKEQQRRLGLELAAMIVMEKRHSESQGQAEAQGEGENNGPFCA